MLGKARSVAALVLVGLGGCPWFTTFDDQPRLEPWEQQWSDTVRWVQHDKLPARENPQFSVPITGLTVPAYLVSLAPTPSALDSLAGIPNPTPPSDTSLANGRRYYQINCAVCHGAAGAGNGPVVRFGMPAPSLLTPVTQARADGYLYGIIRNGRGLMPTYNRIEDMDRWDVVNYVRALQGKLAAPADTSPAGRPGQNGASVPGYTRTAPTRPVPYFHAPAAPSEMRQAADTTTRSLPAHPPARQP